MRRAIALCMILIPGVAVADQTMPDSVAGDARPTWYGRCAARLERARADLTRADARFKNAIVESVAHEMPVRGDPTARGTLDTVELRLRALGVYALVEPKTTPAAAFAAEINADQAPRV